MARNDCCSPNDNCSAPPPARKRSWFGIVGQLLFVYAVSVFLGGTLINTGNPVAVETGRLIHTITFVEPATQWSASHGLRPVSFALNFLSEGVDLSRFG